MKNRSDQTSAFSFRSLMLAAVPSYVFPVSMSFLSGFFLQRSELMQASYSTIGLSSLFSTILSLIILWQFNSKGILVKKKLIRSMLIILLMVGLGILCAIIFQLPSERFNIAFSAFLGAAIVTVRQHVKKTANEKK